MTTFLEFNGRKKSFSSFNRARKFAKANSITQIFVEVYNYISTQYIDGEIIKSFYETKIFSYSV